MKATIRLGAAVIAATAALGVFGVGSVTVPGAQGGEGIVAG